MSRRMLLLFVPTLLVAGGPDRGGYRWADSDGPGGPRFSWIDITGSGTRIQLGDDDNQGPFALGFGFDFYGQVRDSVRVCSNGWLSFASASHQFHHHPIPDVRDPNSLLAPLWTDLDPAQGGAVFYLSDVPRGRFTVSWVGVPVHGTNDSLTFQVVLDTSGSFVFQYLSLGADSCSVGIENDSGLVGLEYLRNGLPQENRLHDSLAIRFFRLQHDACASAVLRPMEQVFAGDSIAPLVLVWNAGLSPASFPVALKIGSYEQEMTVTALAPLCDTQLQFPCWIPAADTYSLELTTSLAGDEFTANDTFRMVAAGSYAGELRYDDGQPDTWFLRNGSPTSDWAGAVRFSVPYGQFRLRGAKVCVGDVTPFSQVLVCPDSSGAPKLGSAYLQAESVAAGQPESWLSIPSDTLVAPDGDLWLVAFWPRRAAGPRIGEDRDLPIDGRSYYGSPTVRWFSCPDGDLLARLLIDGRTGVSELELAGIDLPGAHPNPFRSHTAVRLAAAGRGDVAVYDAGGREVRRLLAVDGTAIWDGRDASGRLLPAGTYFIESTIISGRRVVQVLLTH